MTSNTVLRPDSSNGATAQRALFRYPRINPIAAIATTTTTVVGLARTPDRMVQEYDERMPDCAPRGN